MEFVELVARGGQIELTGQTELKETRRRLQMSDGAHGGQTELTGLTEDRGSQQMSERCQRELTEVRRRSEARGRSEMSEEAHRSKEGIHNYLRESEGVHRGQTEPTEVRWSS